MGSNIIKQIKAHLTLLAAISLVALATNAHAASWYVDIDNNGGNENGTSWTTAWGDSGDIDWGRISSGDTIYFAAGTYSTLRIGKSGQSGAPITIRAAQDGAHAGKATFDGNNAVSLNMGSYDHINLNGNYNGSRNLRFTDSSDSQNSKCIESPSGRADYWTINSIEVDNCGIGLRDAYTTGLEIEDSYFHDIRGDAAISITCYTTCSASDYWGAIQIHDNEIQLNHASSNNGAGPDGIQAGPGVDFYNNEIYGAEGTVYGGQHQDLIQAQNRYWRIYGNDFYNSSDSCIDFDLFTPGITKWEHVWIYNNTFRSTISSSEWRYPQSIRAYSTGGSSISTINDVLIANNTFVDLLFTHIRIYFQNPSINNVVTKNNLFYNTGSNSNSCVYVGDSYNASANDWGFDFNLINAGSSGIGYVAIDNNCSATASCSSGDRYIQSNLPSGTPSFVRYSAKSTSNDLRLLSGDTAAKDRGVDLSAYFTTDKDGKTRSGAWDIGAYESDGTGGGGGGTTVDAPTNLRVVGSQP